MLAIHRVLHPTDFSDLSRPAFDLACTFASDYGAELVLCHVVPWPVGGMVEGVAIDVPGDPVGAAQTRLGQMRSPGPRAPVVHRLEQGDAATEILRVAADLKPDLIVMGTHGRTGLPRLLIGSVAELVVRKAPCPVLTVRAGCCEEPARAAPVPQFATA